MRKFSFLPFFEADNGGDPGATTPEGGGTEPPKSFTQEDIDRIVNDRLTRERNKFADYDETKSQLAALQAEKAEREQAEMTEAQRVEAERAAAVQRAEEAETARDTALQTANKRLINAEFRVLAQAANVRSDALADALVLADLSGASVDDDGNVTGVSEAIKALVETKPFLLAAPKQPEPIGSPSGGDAPKPDKTKEQRLAEASEQVRRNPTPERLAAFSKLKRELGL